MNTPAPQPSHAAWFAEGGAMEQVTGFVSPRAARIISAILSHQAAKALRGALAEIGVYYGKTFAGLALAAVPGERVLGVDIFPDDTRTAVIGLLRQILPQDGGGEVMLWTADSKSVSAASWIERLARPARFVHIDGDHRYRAVINDLLLADAHLVDGAAVIVDDFLHDWYPDVTEGVFDALKAARNIRPVAVIPRTGELTRGGTKLVCCTPDAVGDYTQLVHETFPEARFRQTTIAGHAAISILTQ